MKTLIKTLEGFAIAPPVVLTPILLALLYASYRIVPEFVEATFRSIFVLSPIWLPVVFVIVFWKIWVPYIRSYLEFYGQEKILLEVRIPREVVKSPLAMETIITNLHAGFGETSFIDRYVTGKTRAWFSLEIVSIEGEIHFYIWTRKFLKNFIEAQIYGQYPDMEVKEVNDYASEFSYDKEKYSLFGCDLQLTDLDAYPIKTYVDYGLSDDPKEELKVDPMSGFFEFLSKMGPGEQIWLQMIIRVNKGDRPEDKIFKPGFPFGTTTTWKDEAKSEIEKIRKEATPEVPDFNDPTKVTRGFPNPTPGQVEKLKAIDRTLGKIPFDTGMRVIYLAKKDNFNGANIPSLLLSFRQLSAPNHNSIGPVRWHIMFDYPWQDFRGLREERMRRRLADAYRRRAWFHSPYKTKSFIMSAEELATIFHFPGAVSEAPSLPRITSRRGEAPANLPT
ncbi:MAG: hypothetical protein QF858_02805 [Candidatus Pacebacteria bacterium]|jgi:hypothetical protein|nr:hypothetical protein [bacterium]MDP6527784.1 hypothetical protein [Candidatus Paceibacterota bacterium]MDP6659621.1 hypothetical protein [Candidatus Paceibacterota bacterium]|tara:strand:- start:47374 stop:48714 length:1341 start_codon:yes stop_codon:yes gene_type:complete